MTDLNHSLYKQLQAKKQDFEKNALPNKKKAYKRGIDAVKQSKIIEKALQVGDKAPNFMLKNALGKSISLYDYLQEGKVILTWYRGNWCPYCNMTLRQLQLELPNFNANNTTLIALTPELPDESISTAEKHALQFEVLSDIGNIVAKQYGIVFELTSEVAAMYNQAFELNNHNGDNSNELPLAATYIINENKEIVYAFLDADYRNRAEPSDLTDFLRGS